MITFDQSPSGACPRSDGRALKIREAHTLACAITDPVGHSIVLMRSRRTTTYCTSVPSALSGVGDAGGDGGGDGEGAAEHMVGSERLGGERQERRGGLGGSKVGVRAGTSASVHAESRACSEISPTRIRSSAERTQCKEETDGREVFRFRYV